MASTCQSAGFVVNHRFAYVLFDPSKLYSVSIFTFLEHNKRDILSTRILFSQRYFYRKSLNYKKYILRLNIFGIILENFLEVGSKRKKYQTQFFMEKSAINNNKMAI